MKKEQQEYIQRWIQRAEQDFKLVNIVLDSNDPQIPFNLMCYHCQQCVEKYLKAYIIFLGLSYPKTHNISQLIAVASKVDEGIIELNSTDILTGYAIESRYPDDYYMPSAEEAHEAIRMVKTVKEYIASRVSSIWLNPISFPSCQVKP